MKKGFTLLELVIVIIILGILATLGFTQYAKIVEKGRSAEARTVLGQLRTAQFAYYLKYGTYASMSEMPLGGLSSCATTHFFSYATNGATGVCAATRCSAGGKPPNIAAADVYSLTLDINGAFSGSAGYY